jgi:ATP/maltotriose-dependent transcriptional regulator MalT
VCLFVLGEWEELAELLAEALAWAPPPLYRCGLLISHIELAIARGDLATAAESAAECAAIVEEYPETGRMQPGHYAPRLRVALAQGDPSAAATLLWHALGDTELMSKPIQAWELLGIGGQILVAQPGRNQRVKDEAARLRAELDAASRRLTAKTRWEQAWQLTYLADTSDGDRSVPAWDAAVEQWRDLRAPYRVAEALVRGAQADLEAGDRSGASARLREADAIADSLGAVPLASEIEQLARRARLSPAPAPAPVAGIEAERRHGLTPRELEVLRLIADGRSNRQIAADLFISANTAGVHVSRILAKLGVTTRTEAAALAHRLNLFDS